MYRHLKVPKIYLFIIFLQRHNLISQSCGEAIRANEALKVVVTLFVTPTEPNRAERARAAAECAQAAANAAREAARVYPSMVTTCNATTSAGCEEMAFKLLNSIVQNSIN